MGRLIASAILPVTAIIFSLLLQVSNSSFYINYEENSFYMDGQPFRYVSGSLHYFRIPREYWRDRLIKCRAAGLNAISTYVEWNQHESSPGTFDFAGDLDLQHFIRLAQEEGLYVILRPGPYICAERDMGGLPHWLLNKHPDIRLRTSDVNYTKYVERWMDVLLPEISPLLYGKGGPIILVQVENEYGSYDACDQQHLIWLRDLFRKHIGDDAVLFTTDGASSRFLQCGKIPGVYATVDFGPKINAEEAFSVQRQFEPKGPLVNSEYYPGWLTHWGEKMAHTGTQIVTKTLTDILDMGANVNFYMFHGGTNFGFTAGANYFDKYTSDITSYDYDAPISEAGDLTQKYFAIRDVLLKYLPASENIIVGTSQKGDYGEVTLTATANLLSPIIKQLLGDTYENQYPLSFEAVNQNFGYMLYETEIGIKEDVANANLVVPVLNDFGNVYINGILQGTLSREFRTNRVLLRNLRSGDKLSIVVENLGRINFGPYINDTKGILSNVVLDEEPLISWHMTGFDLKDVTPLELCSSSEEMKAKCQNGEGFTFYKGKFTLPTSNYVQEKLDTFLDVSSLVKGVVFVNNRNLGRYWSARGPQYNLYVPGVYLNDPPQENSIVVMDEYVSAASIKVKFSKNPNFSYKEKEPRLEIERSKAIPLAQPYDRKDFA